MLESFKGQLCNKQAESLKEYRDLDPDLS